jgi:hypothetical protein
VNEMLQAFRKYIGDVERERAAGKATEPTYYPYLKNLLEGLGTGISATSNPKRIECGAPDFEVCRGETRVGYVEAKDVGTSLDEAEKTEQLRRYRASLPNLVLTDYLEFRWYVDGERRAAARLGMVALDGKVKRDGKGMEAVGELLGEFLAREAEVVGTPKGLAVRMARLARMIRDLIVAAFEKEAAGGTLHTQITAFREHLIPDLTVQQFADMYAQTIAYGLFAARATGQDGQQFSRQNAAYLLPKTNPFLRNLFSHIAGPQLDERIAWLVDDLAQVLGRADMAAVLEDFGKRTKREDPVVHFYETFLKAYDPKERKLRGVYYTPEPVVSYIVRSIDSLLRKRFGRPLGLADPTVLVLDPAVGTGTFLYNVVKLIHEVLCEKGQQGAWNDYVAEKLLPRLFGFELLMAPYAVAHLKLGLLLQELGYKFGGDQRLGVYLTNTLEEAIKKSEMLFGEFIVEEANAAAEIKKEKPIMVVVGNPPYAGHSANASWRTWEDPKTGKQRRELTWIGRLIQDYYKVDGEPLGEKNPKWLQDDYVKFLRFGQWRIDSTGQGVLAFITNHSYLDNPTFRGMRQSLMNTFTDIYLLDLHGNVRKKERAPDGGQDENVFDMQQGVAIGIFVKESGKTGPARVHHADLWGSREGKYGVLGDTDGAATDWKEVAPKSSDYLFLARDEHRLGEYEKEWKVTDIFSVGSVGIVTARDALTIGWSREDVLDTVRDFGSLPAEEARQKYGLGEDVRDWKVCLAQEDLNHGAIDAAKVAQVLYRPFDWRYTYYTGQTRGFICMPRPEVMPHMMAGANVGLIATRQTRDKWDVLATRSIISHKSMAAFDINSLFPLYLYPIASAPKAGQKSLLEAEPWPASKGGRRPNLNPQFIADAEKRLPMQFMPDGRGDLADTFGPEDVFHYAYAVFHSPTYRSRYAEFLKVDFPRLPLTSDKKVFGALVEKGAELVSLHLMEASALNTLTTKYPVAGSNTVEKVRYEEKGRRVWINSTQYFESVPPEVWGFHVGGYQVCEKWLKDRKGRKLTWDDVQHYQKVVVALAETIRLMGEIDAVIPSWPLK